jgi:hypothetical protein
MAKRPNSKDMIVERHSVNVVRQRRPTLGHNNHHKGPLVSLKCPLHKKCQLDKVDRLASGIQSHQNKKIDSK